MFIRSGFPSDAPAIRGLADMTLERHFWMPWTPESIFQPCHKVLVAIQERKLIGFAIGSQGQNKGYLLAVHPDYQGRGTGTRLARDFRRWNVLRKSLPFFNRVGFKTVKMVRKSTRGRSNDTFLVDVI